MDLPLLGGTVLLGDTVLGIRLSILKGQTT